MASGSNKTYADALIVLSHELTTMMGLADSNLPFCAHLLQEITQERRSPELAMQQAGVLPSSAGNPQGAGQLGLPGGLPPGIGGMPMGGMPGGPGGPGGMSAPGPSFLGAGVPGAGPQTAPPPLDPAMMRQILAGGGHIAPGQ